MKNFNFKIYFWGMIVFAFFVFTSVRSQEMTSIQLESFDVEFSPETPGANTLVNAQVISYTFDVNRASISWILNGKKAGTGKTFSFVTAEVGFQTTLQVSIITPSGKALTESYSFGAAEADLLWEASTYTPVQYRGKALPVSTATVKITAMPFGFKTADDNLIYEWKRNGKNFPEQSGRGKKTFTFFVSEWDSENIIEVTVSNTNQNIVAKNATEIKTAEPKILFYEEHPLEGVQNQRELSSVFTLKKSEFISKAEPFFFNKRNLSKLNFEWRINSRKIETPIKANLLLLSAPKEKGGTSIISLAVQNLENLIEFAEKSLQINLEAGQ